MSTSWEISWAPKGRMAFLGEAAALRYGLQCCWSTEEILTRKLTMTIKKQMRKKCIWSLSEVLKLECALESPGGLVKIQISGSHTQSSWFSRCGVEPENLHFFWQVLKLCWSGGHTWRATALNEFGILIYQKSIDDDDGCRLWGARMGKAMIIRVWPWNPTHGLCSSPLFFPSMTFLLSEQLV